ncbi:MAG: hypothetical protein NVSMB29_08330 [Candidatus Dormibacteria bacterium]
MIGLAGALLARAGGGHSFSGGGGGGGGSFGGSSYGGGGYSSGGGYYGGGYYGGGYGGFGGGGISFLVILIILFVVLIPLLRLGFSLWSSGRLGSMSGGGAPGYGYAGPPAGMAASGAEDPGQQAASPRFQGAALPGSDEQGMGGGGDSVAGLEAIRAHDPGFDENAFLARSERVFFVVQQAWSQCNPMLSRQVMADGIWQQHKAQIDNYIAMGRRNLLDGLAIGNARITGAHTDASFDTVTVRIRAASADYDVDVRSGQIVRGGAQMQEWQEDWLFQRSSKAVTKPQGGLGEQRCPNCGAPLDVDLAGVCSYCKASVMSGAYDWVLSRIEQV